MKRKVIQIAGSTQLLSLPRKWALRNGIKKGDELEVVEEGTQLVIHVGSGAPLEKKGEVQFSDAQSFFKSPLSTLYKLGYTEVTVHYNDPEVPKLVHNHLEELMGFEIVHQHNNSLVIKNVAEPMKGEFEAIFRRLFLTVISSANESLMIIKRKQYNALKSVFTIEKTINKLTFLCERLLNMSGYSEKDKTHFMYAIVSRLEALGDFVARICEVVDEEKPAVSQAVLQLYAKVLELLQMFYDLFYKYDVKGLATYHQLVEQLRGDGKKILMAKKGPESVMAHFLLEIVDHLYEMGTFLWQRKS